MPIRLEFQPVPLSPGMELYRYWGASGYSRPTTEVYLVGPSGNVCIVPSVHLDTGSDFAIFQPKWINSLALSPPFQRTVQVSTGGGMAAFIMPNDGEVSLLITDYREYYYLPAPPVGFWTNPNKKNVLGVTGFFQYFSTQTHNDGQSIPVIELTENRRFPGQHGSMRGESLHPLLHRLKGAP